MATKLDLLTLTDLGPSAINAWLGLCQDSFDAWALMNLTKTMDDNLHILLASIKMEAATAAVWWSENRKELRKLKTWLEFSTAVKECFVPATWHLDALSTYYDISQGSSPFMDFVSCLQNAQNVLASAEKGYMIHDCVLRNHLFFHAHHVLCLCVCTNSSLDLSSIHTDALISLMSSTWNSMEAEGIVSATRRPPSNLSSTPYTCPSPIPAAIATPAHPGSYPLPNLLYAEHEALRIMGGCYHCHLTPSSPKWKQHNSRNCPGDKSRNIPPRTPIALQNIGAITPANDLNTDLTTNDFEERETCTVTTILPEALIQSDEYQDLVASFVNSGTSGLSCVLGDGSFNSDDSYWG